MLRVLLVSLEFLCFSFNALSSYGAQLTFCSVGPGCGAPWDKATCDTDPIADAAQDQDVRWASVDTESAWTAAINAWKANSNGPLTFSRYITEQVSAIINE